MSYHPINILNQPITTTTTTTINHHQNKIISTPTGLTLDHLSSSIPVSIPTCANCSTQITNPFPFRVSSQTTPLWRRDESGATLCNACALFQKMKGRPRPISLKTDVIKQRHRIKAIDREIIRFNPLQKIYKKIKSIDHFSIQGKVNQVEC
ncbi:uncharacterized protein MELLADRAFT_87653 [Melampsora larici-populina 98AG31]|uniref:GATA-type domain-containing protein n=1 Tax=Melampsora larici-populina (strain 98AG31 / pathotype 3-4-7) TaxID=747676 RepID=F4RP77_MELLP|nr:uncharacterized protein MELLADRAFT_87653 [Melampsora larici-populina 98AG31]EGG05897.1 hypothetical protein MELLADRAFT_87653 [Melampsora larici-populina 98AG31]